MKKSCLLLVLVTIKIYAFQPPIKLLPKTKPAPARPRKSIKQLIEEDKTRKVETYYDAAHIKALDQQKIQKHAPMLILIDQLQGETEATTTLALTFELSYGIKRQAYPILVTASLLKNLLTRMSQKSDLNNKAIQDFTPILNSVEWKIFNVDNSQFVLLIPTHFLNVYGSNLGLKVLPEITSLLDGKTNQAFQEYLSKNKTIIPFTKNDLEKVFIPKTNTSPTPIWNFIVMGHGTDSPPIIANLKPAVINEMFAFFDTAIKTGMVLIISCLSGGSNRKLLETTESGIQINHNFILILSSVANEISTSKYPIDYDYANLFFNNAAQIQDKGSSFDTFWQDLAKSKIQSQNKSVHGFQNIPQVWFPGGIGFQSAKIEDLVLPIGNVLLKTSKENNEPIIILGEALVLIFPPVIDVPIIVFPIHLTHALNKKNWEYIPHIFEFSFSKNDKQIYSKILSDLLIPQLLTLSPSINESSVQLLDSLYPQFISLNTTGSSHLFTNINVESIYYGETSNILGVGMGVIQFIRDAFLDINKHSEARIYFIDKLTGFNDISLLLEGSRLVRNDSNKHYLEHYLQNFVGQNITLENVMILTNNRDTRFTIYFAIADTYWYYSSSLAQEDAKTFNWWNFRMAGNVRSTYNRDYQKYKNQLVQKPESINQKSISTVLEERQRQILLKKALELKNNPGAVQKLQPLKLTPITKPKPAAPLSSKTPALLKPKTMPAAPIPTSK